MRAVDQVDTSLCNPGHGASSDCGRTRAQAVAPLLMRMFGACSLALWCVAVAHVAHVAHAGAQAPSVALDAQAGAQVPWLALDASLAGSVAPFDVTSVRLLTERFTLDERLLAALSQPELTLTAPCLGCRSAGPLGANVELAGVAPAPTRAGAARARPPSPGGRPIAIGESWRWSRGREFSIHLTPTPRECAPLVKLKF